MALAIVFTILVLALGAAIGLLEVEEYGDHENHYDRYSKEKPKSNK